MPGNDIVFQLPIDADLETVRAAVVDANGVRGWWTADATMDGDRPVLVFPGADAPYDFAVTENDPGRVAWAAADHPPNWRGTTISYDLAPGDGGTTMLSFRHGEFADDDARGMIGFAWAQILTRLKAYAETGEARPFFGSD